MNSESELLKALSEMVVTPDPVIEYRFYYSNTGRITHCAMIPPYPDGDNYVVVNEAEYNQYFRYTIIKGKPELIKNVIGIELPLIKSDFGFKVVQNNAALLIEANESYEQIEY